MRVLAISVHPDDETMGCGGTLLKHRQSGDELFWLIVTQAWEPQWSAQTIARKAEEVEQVGRAYPFTRLYKLGFPTTRLDTLPQSELMDGIRNVVSEVRPDWVYTVNRSDIHSDHRVVFESAMSVLKPFAAGQAVSRLLCFECLSSTEAAPPLAERAFVPHVYVDITPFLERKIEILRFYQSEAHDDPLPRGPSAIRALARYRGATVGVEYAEAFMLIRELR